MGLTKQGWTRGQHESYAKFGDASKAHLEANWLSRSEWESLDGERKTGATLDEMHAIWTAYYIALRGDEGCHWATIRLTPGGGCGRKAFVSLYEDGRKYVKIYQGEYTFETRPIKKWDYVPQWPKRAGETLERDRSVRQTVRIPQTRIRIA